MTEKNGHVVSFLPQLLHPWEMGRSTHWILGWVGPRAIWMTKRGEKLALSEI